MTPDEAVLKAIALSQTQIIGYSAGGKAGTATTVRTVNDSILGQCFGNVSPGVCTAVYAEGVWHVVNGDAVQIRERVVEFSRKRSAEVAIEPYWVVFIAVNKIVSDFVTPGDISIANNYYAWDGQSLQLLAEVGQPSYRSQIESVPVPGTGNIFAITKNITPQLDDVLKFQHSTLLGPNAYIFQYGIYNNRFGESVPASAEPPLRDDISNDFYTVESIGSVFVNQDSVLSSQVPYELYPYVIDVPVLFQGPPLFPSGEIYPSYYSNELAQYAELLAFYWSKEPGGVVWRSIVEWNYRLDRNNITSGSYPYEPLQSAGESGYSIENVNIDSKGRYTWIPGGQRSISDALAGRTYPVKRLGKEPISAKVTRLPVEDLHVPLTNQTYLEYLAGSPLTGPDIVAIADGNPINSAEIQNYYTDGITTEEILSVYHLATKVWLP